jgi:PIN domain nuclease of toxin-antitoxin system
LTTARTAAPAAVLLDTYVLVWLVGGDTQLSARARRQIAAATTVWVSAITPWEIGMLVAKGRLTLAQDPLEWLDAVLALPGIRLAGLEPAIAVASSRLPGDLPGDPADRIIAATARHLDAKLVTADEKLLAYGAAGFLSAVSAV